MPLKFSTKPINLLLAAAPAFAEVALYASLGKELTHYRVDVGAATLAKQASVSCPASIQYAWQHPSRRYLYVAWSDGGPSGAAGAPSGGSRHGVSAFQIDPATGALQPHGGDAPLISRPVHLSTDITGVHLLVAHTIPSALTVLAINADRTIGAPVAQPQALDAGVYAHQVRVHPSNRTAIVVARGNMAAAGKPEDPGSLKVFRIGEGGLLANQASIAPGGGINFQPRHLDFHPTQPWLFLSMEGQNQLQVYKIENGAPGAEPLFTKDSLDPSARGRASQAAGTVHVHPNGRFVYQANRASGTETYQGQSVFAGGENSIAVFAINAATGEPVRIQSVSTRGVSPRTFTLDPEGRILVAANQVPILVRSGSGVKQLPASLAMYRVRRNGKLRFVRQYDVEATNARSLFWMGIVPLP